MCDDSSPLEYSLSIKKNSCVVRFAFEPLPLTDELRKGDRVNYFAPSQWLADHQREHKAVDLTWFDTLSGILLVKPDMQSSPNPAACGLTQLGFALDLTKEPLLKIYIWPDAVARQSAPSSGAWNGCKQEHVLRAMDAIGLATPWRKVVDYLDRLRRSSPEHAGQPEFIAWDARSPATARMKVYVRFAKANLEQVLSHLDLGGMLDSAHTKEIKNAAAEIWDVFSSDGDPRAFQMVSGDLQGYDERTRGVLIYYELRQGEVDPSAKFYLPVRHYFSSDLPLAERFDKFLAEKQLQKAGWYTSLLNRFCDHRPLESRAGLQAVVGCAVRDGEWEVSMYISSEAYAAERFI
ncbi:aromatic prenyltransferase, partial [Mycena pura]